MGKRGMLRLLSMEKFSLLLKRQRSPLFSSLHCFRTRYGIDYWNGYCWCGFEWSHMKDEFSWHQSESNDDAIKADYNCNRNPWHVWFLVACACNNAWMDDCIERDTYHRSCLDLATEVTCRQIDSFYSISITNKRSFIETLRATTFVSFSFSVMD